MNLFKNKKIISFLVASILVLSFSVCAYANDGPEANTSGDRLATQEELQILDSDLYSTAESLYSLVSLSDTRATEKTVTDIYNWLNSYFGTDFGNHGSTYPDLVYSRLEQIRQLCNTINTSCNALVVKVTQFYNSINPDYETVGISIYDQLSAIATALTSVDSTDGDLTIVEILLYMHSELEDINTNLTAILNSSYSIDNKLVSIISYLVNFRTDMNTGFSTIDTSINTGFTNVNANMATIISRLQTMNNDFNQITWNNNNSLIVGFYDSINSSTPVSPGSNLSSGSYYLKCNYITLNANSIMRFTLPIHSYTLVDINNFISSTSFVTSSGVLYISNYYVDFDYIRNKIYVYVYNTPLSAYASFYLKLDFSNNFTLDNNNFDFSYITDVYYDFYTVYNYLTFKTANQFMFKFDKIYASDDLIQAKEEQQTYEDTAIEDFTGSGSASASISDLGGLKSVSSAFKSGLDSGASVSNALSIFSSNSGFWGWFSQSNYNDINNLAGSVSNTRSGNSPQEDIIDYYSDNMFNLLYLLQNVGD